MSTITSAGPSDRPVEGIMICLRDETADLHRAAETRPFQKQMVKGEISRDQFVGYLGQLFLVHTALEELLDRSRYEEAVIEQVWRDDRRRVPNLVVDLSFYGADTEGTEPTAAVRQLVADLESFAAKSPLALIGALYVLEGSTNGNRFVARAVSRPLQVPPGAPGLRYFDPYGDEQPVRWQAFKDDMNALHFDDEQRDALLLGARRMFEGIADISDAIAG